MPLYRRVTPTIVAADLYDGRPATADRLCAMYPGLTIDYDREPRLILQTPEGHYNLMPGQWIVREPFGHIRVETGDQFVADHVSWQDDGVTPHPPLPPEPPGPDAF